MRVTRPATALQEIDRRTERLADYNSGKITMSGPLHEALIAELWRLNREVERHFAKPSRHEPGSVRGMLAIACIITGVVVTIPFAVVLAALVLRSIAPL